MAAISSQKTLHTIWEGYNENKALLTAYSAPKESVGSIAAHMDLVNREILEIKEKNKVPREISPALIEKQCQIMDGAYFAIEKAQEIILELQNAVEFEAPKLKKFPFQNQVEKLKDLAKKVEVLIEGSVTLFTREIS